MIDNYDDRFNDLEREASDLRWRIAALENRLSEIDARTSSTIRYGPINYPQLAAAAPQASSSWIKCAKCTAQAVTFFTPEHGPVVGYCSTHAGQVLNLDPNREPEAVQLSVEESTTHIPLTPEEPPCEPTGGLPPSEMDIRNPAGFPPNRVR